MQNHVRAGRGDELNAMTQFADASTLWLARLRDQVEDGTRSPSTCENYERQLRIHVLPAMGAVRLGEVTTPLVDRVIRMIKRSISPATAKTCKSVISGVMGLGPAQGATMANPVREIERIEAMPKDHPAGCPTPNAFCSSRSSSMTTLRGAGTSRTWCSSCSPQAYASAKHSRSSGQTSISSADT